MAHGDRSSHDDLIRDIAEHPYRYGFYQAMRRVEANHPESPGFARSRRARQDPVRLGQEASLSFARSTLAQVQERREFRPERLLQYFHGVFGPNGPLPIHLTEYAMERTLSWHDTTLERFCDIFHHRMISLFYRIWADAEPAVCEDRPKDNRFRIYVGALTGLGTPSLRNQDEFSDQAKLFHAGHYSSQKRSAEGLLAIVSQQFSMPVKLNEFEPEWLELPEEARLYLGQSLHTGRLGTNTVIGGRTYERQFRFALEFGPLTRQQFEYLLPDQRAPDTLAALVRNYVGLEFTWEYRIVVLEEEVPTARLGQYGQLGWSTWLSGRQRQPESPDFFHVPETEFRPMENVNG